MEDLLGQLLQFNIFSANECKILAYLIYNPQVTTGKIVSEELHLSDSKVYPALKHLVETSILIRDDASRPHRFYLATPDRLIGFLQEQVNQHMKQYQQLLDQCSLTIMHSWHSAYPLSEKTGQIFIDDSIITQLHGLSTVKTETVRYFLAPKMEPFLKQLGETIERQLFGDVIIKVCIPQLHSFIEELKPSLPKVKEITQSNLKSESYIIFDRELVFILQHQVIGTLGIFSSDPAVISKINKLWNESEFRTELHHILRFE